MAHVVGADGVAGRIPGRDVLDQVEQAALRRDCVEAEVASQAQNRSYAQPRGVQNRQRGSDARKLRAGLDQYEHPAVSGEPAGGSVVGHGRNGEAPRKHQRRQDLTAATPDSRDDRMSLGRKRHVASRAGRARHSHRADVDAEDRQSVGLSVRHGDRRRSARHSHHRDSKSWSQHLVLPSERTLCWSYVVEVPRGPAEPSRLSTVGSPRRRLARTWSQVHSGGSLSGRKRRNLVPCRKRFPSSLS